MLLKLKNRLGLTGTVAEETPSCTGRVTREEIATLFSAELGYRQPARAGL